MHAQLITITKVKAKGSNMIRYNVDLNGVPFGQIWTFKATGEVHGYHAKPLNGEHAEFANYADAERYMRAAM